MPLEYYDKIRAKLPEGYKQNPFVQLLKDRKAIEGPMQGTPEEFSQILYALTRGDLNRRNEHVAYEFIAPEKKNILKFSDGSLFSVVKAKGTLVQSLIVVTPYAPSMDYFLNSQEMMLARLVFDGLKMQENYMRVADEFHREERKLAAEEAAEERRITRESSIEAALATIEKAKSRELIMIRGLHNIDALVKLGFVPGLVDNPDNWIDADDFPGMWYCHEQSRIEVILTGREKFRPIEELSKLEFYFIVNRSDDDPGSFGRMLKKFRGTGMDGVQYSTKKFHDDLIAMAKYPEELKGRTEEDLGLMADEVGQVIDRRQRLDKGILPYEAVFNKDTQGIIDYVVKNSTPAAEIRKALDYFEYTGMIDGQYKTELAHRIQSEIAAGSDVNRNSDDIFCDKRVKEIVAAVLKKLSHEQLTAKTITLAMAPYVSELGFGRLVKIRERILQLKELVHDQDKGIAFT